MIIRYFKSIHKVNRKSLSFGRPMSIEPQKLSDLQARPKLAEPRWVLALLSEPADAWQLNVWVRQE